MKVKLLHVLTVCLVTLTVLSPGLVVFSVVWGRHIELVKTQNLGCESNKSSAKAATLSPQTISTNSSQHQTSIPDFDRNCLHPVLTTAEQYKLAVILQWFILLTPIFVGLGIIVYDRYLVYRAAVLQEQIEMLERLWQQSIEQ
ncbi:hypothetical protein I8752_10350 [Nostocaceae cyanobacterium CENA369]|uniref:Uncharacterized protein n=1 Tax=Dendronalium phyllosphericum CENA369 TaxID=1725256 RepID=A0A8J7I3M9_9NOST|nr:hypothetical protein [Dendronalium phyllosphericum]MBH8573408.1 hypothetical protein [Dendronalium phyllosphericum CENA369]